MLFSIAGESYQVPTLWEIVRDLRRKVTENLSVASEDMRAAVALTATELAENLVKYGVQDSASPPILSVEEKGGVLRVETRNLVASQHHAQNVLACVKRISEHPDAGELYAEAISETLDLRVSGSQQGFYRIAAVAEFQLSAELNGQCLTVLAERGVE